MANDTTSGKSLIQEQVAAMLVEPLQADSVVLNAGPTIFDSSAPLNIPTLEEGFTPGFVGENEQIPDESARFGEIKLMPTSRKGIKTITRVSNELIRSATVGVSDLLQRRIVADVANVLDTALLVGDGADDSITGIVNQPGVTKVAHDPADPDAYLNALAVAASHEVRPTRFIVNGADFYNLRKIKDKNGRYILQDSVADGAAGALFEVPVTVSNKLPAGKAVLANMADIAVVRDINPTVTILTERYAEYDQVGIRVTARFDLGLIRPEGVLVLDSAAE